MKHDTTGSPVLRMVRTGLESGHKPDLLYRFARGHFSGLVKLTRPRSNPDTLVGLYHCSRAGMCTDGGSYATVCELHGTIIVHDTSTMARSHMAYPKGWCEDCNCDKDIG